MEQSQTVTINLDQVENQTMKGVMSAFDTYRRVIEALQKQNAELQAVMKVSVDPAPMAP